MSKENALTSSTESSRPESANSTGNAIAAQAWEQPLDMAVHSLGTRGQTTDGVQRTRRGRFWMLLVWLICAAPVVASYLSFYVFRPQSIQSYGELIEPQVALPNAQVHSLDGQPINLQSLTGQWLLISVASGACDAACEQRLYLQRQLRESLGKEKDRVDWVWLISDDAAVPQSLRPALSAATVLRVPPKRLEAWLAPAAGQALSDHLYLVDPLGHWMMRFPAALSLETASSAKRDLDRVLRASQSWHKPRR